MEKYRNSRATEGESIYLYDQPIKKPVRTLSNIRQIVEYRTPVFIISLQYLFSGFLGVSILQLVITYNLPHLRL